MQVSRLLRAGSYAPCFRLAAQGAGVRHMGSGGGTPLKWVGLIPNQAPYDQKNATLKRPLSPHLTIYKPQLTSMLSITHRGTGIFMAGVLSASAIGYMAVGAPLADHLAFVRELAIPGACLYVAKFGLAFPLCYHYANGLRHLAWDALIGLDISTLYKTGWFVLGTASVAAAVVASL